MYQNLFHDFTELILQIVQNFKTMKENLLKGMVSTLREILKEITQKKDCYIKIL